MGFGGYHPYARRFGGATPALEAVQESVGAQRGTAYDSTNPATVVWLENHAIARIIVDAWGANERLANQWDPLRMTDFLPRWETILKLVPIFGATGAARRRAVAKKRRAAGVKATHATFYVRLAEELGPAFVAVEYISPANAVVHVPDGSYPWGSVVDGVPWYSTIDHYLVRSQKPAGWTEGSFYEAVSKVFSTLDDIVPVYATYDWYRAPVVGTPISVVGGPSAGGFYLDEPDLDLLAFDV